MSRIALFAIVLKNGKRKYPMRVAWDDTSWLVKADWPRMKPTSIKLVGCV